MLYGLIMLTHTMDHCLLLCSIAGAISFMVLFQVSWFQLVSCRREIVLVGGTILHGEQSIHLCCSIWFVLEKIRGHSKARSNPWGELKMGFLKALYSRLSIIHFIKIFFFCFVEALKFML